MTSDFYVDLYLENTALSDRIAEDIKSSDGIVLRYGISGSGPFDRVAAVGTLELTLDNSARNIGGVEGYYSPDHPSRRSNFKVNQKILFLIGSVGLAKAKQFWGRISNISPSPGKYNDHGVTITVQDYMAQLMNHTLKAVPVQIGKRTDQIVSTIISDIGISPIGGTYLGVTPDTFAYALDDIEETATAMHAIQRLCQSDGSFLYVPDYNGALKLEPRGERATKSTVDASFDDTMIDLKILHGEETIYNDITVSIARRDVDTTEVVIWSSDGEIELAPMQTLEVTARYVDPASQAERISLYPGSGVTPVAGTDFRMSSITSNSGNDLNANLSISVDWYGNTAKITMQNTHAEKTGYINLLNLRGKGMYQYNKQDARVQDTTSISTYGRRSLQFRLPYQTNLNVAYDIARSLLSRYKDPHTFITGIEFLANKNDTLLGYALDLDVSSRVYVKETVSGVEGYFYVNSLDYQVDQGKFLRCKLGLVPANTSGVWVLGDPTLSVLGSTTIPNLFI